MLPVYRVTIKCILVVIVKFLKTKTKTKIVIVIRLDLIDILSLKVYSILIYFSLRSVLNDLI